MSGLPWFKLYSRIVDDEKLRLLAFEDRWHFVALCALKCSGLLDEPPSDIRERKISVKLGVQVRELEEIARRLREVGLIDDDMQPVAWDTLQPGRDLSTARVRAFREKRASSTASSDETHETVSCAFPKRGETVSHAFPQRDETVLDKEKEIENPPPIIPPPRGEKKRGHRLPEDWWRDDARLPDSLVAAMAAVLADGVELAWLDDQEERFRSYWLNATGKGSVKIDWHAAWQNWLRRALDDVRPGSRWAANHQKPPETGARHEPGATGRGRADPPREHGPRTVGQAVSVALQGRGVPTGSGG